MRKLTFIALLCLTAVSGSAQLRVDSLGKVMIGSATQNPVSKLAFGGVGNNYAKTYFEGDGYVMQLKPLGKSSNMSSSLFGNGLRVIGNPVQNSGLVGVYSSINGTYNSANGFVAGVEGIAGNGKNGYNYGVAGCLTGTKNGAAIFGSVGGNAHSTLIGGRYAGFFNGNVCIEGDLYYELHHIYTFAEGGFMPNQQPMGNMLQRIMCLNPIEYKFPSKPDSLYALTAQDVSTVFPHLISDNNAAVRYIDYLELVPILIKTIQEMQEEIEDLQTQLPQLSRSAFTEKYENASSQQTIADSNDFALFQNVPNPFTERTIIRFTLPNDTKNACICIFDMSGKMLKQVPVDSSMQSITIEGYELQAGMYIYSLLVNGKEIDTKRMILSR